LKKLGSASSSGLPSDPERGRKLVLYVEDEPDNREVTDLRLRDRYEILWARDDREACELVARHHDRIYAVLMDIQLKGSQLDGIQLARVLRGEAVPSAPAHAKGLPPLGAPIIFVTAYGARYSEEQLLAAGGSHVIPKPVDFVGLSLALANAHARKVAQKADRADRGERASQSAGRREPPALRDALTGLFNPTYLETAIASEMARMQGRDRKLGFLLIDVDHLKVYNDRCGRAQGDTLLRQIALLILSPQDPSQARRAPEIACRNGGGEMAILLPDSDLDGTRARAESIRSAIQAFPFTGREGQPKKVISVSVGAAVFPLHATKKEQLVEAAARALQQAKLSGRNRVEIARPVHRD
jgi:diguanylate cyclase (GGDEF)-like protein